MTKAPRLDIDGLIHKALRAAMGATLTAVGRIDALEARRPGSSLVCSKSFARISLHATGTN